VSSIIIPVDVELELLLVLVVVVADTAALWVIDNIVAPSMATTSAEVLITAAFVESALGRVAIKLAPVAVTVKAVETGMLHVAVALSESVTVSEE